MLVSALFVGQSADESNRAVTLGELAAWDFARASKAEVAEKVDAELYVMVGGTATVDANGETGVVSTNWLTPGSLEEAWRFDAASGTAYFRSIGLGGVVLSNWSLGSGSGFPLTNNGDLAGFALTNGAAVQATNGQFGLLSVQGAAALGSVSASSAALGPTTVTGDLTVYGTRFEDQTIIAQHRTDVYLGTNYIYTDEVHHRTNVVYQDTVVITGETRRVTNLVETYVNVGGSFTMSSGSTFSTESANLVKFPGLIATTNGGASVTPTGRLDGSGAEILRPPAQGGTEPLRVLPAGEQLRPQARVHLPGLVGQLQRRPQQYQPGPARGGQGGHPLAPASGQGRGTATDEEGHVGPQPSRHRHEASRRQVHLPHPVQGH